MSSLSSGTHTSNCRTVDIGGGLNGYICVAGCPAMADFLVQPGQATGEVDRQPELTDEQRDRLVTALEKYIGE